MTKRKPELEGTEAVPEEAPTGGPEPTAPSEPSIDELLRRLEDAGRRGEDLLTKLLYAQAEVENVRKRAERDVDEAVQFANERLLASLLSVLDEFDAAAAAVEAGAAKGVAMVRDHVVTILREAGLEEVPTDRMFDPYLHEAVGRVDDEALEDGLITEIVQKGYRLNLKLLRPAKVIVVRKGGET